MIRCKKENHRKSHEHSRLHHLDVPHAITHLVSWLERLEFGPFSLRAQLLGTLPILSTGPHSLFDDPYSLSIGHVNMSLSTLRREMSVIYGRDCPQSVNVPQSI